MFDRWHVYSYLKRVNGKTNFRELITQFPNNEPELIEGIHEYNAMVNSNPGIYDKFAIKSKPATLGCG